VVSQLCWLALQSPKNRQVHLSKRPGLSLIPYQSGKTLAWDASVVCTLADSNIGMAVREYGLDAKCTDKKKVDKYIEF